MHSSSSQRMPLLMGRPRLLNCMHQGTLNRDRDLAANVYPWAQFTLISTPLSASPQVIRSSASFCLTPEVLGRGLAAATFGYYDLVSLQLLGCSPEALRVDVTAGALGPNPTLFSWNCLQHHMVASDEHGSARY